MDAILETILKDNYPNGGWREKLGYDEDNISHFGIIEAKQALDEENPNPKIHHGSFLGDFSSALGEIISARPIEPAPESFSGDCALINDSYTNSTPVVQMMKIMAHVHRHLNQEDGAEKRESRSIDYTKWVLQSQGVVEEDKNLLINVVAGIAFFSEPFATDPFAPQVGHRRTSWLKEPAQSKPGKPKP